MILTTMSSVLYCVTCTVLIDSVHKVKPMLASMQNVLNSFLHLVEILWLILGGWIKSFRVITWTWCSLKISFSWFSGSLIVANWRCSWLNLWTDYPPCSLWNPRPTCHVFIHSTTCSCKICILGVIALSGNMLWYWWSSGAFEMMVFDALTVSSCA